MLMLNKSSTFLRRADREGAGSSGGEGKHDEAGMYHIQHRGCGMGSEPVHRAFSFSREHAAMLFSAADWILSQAQAPGMYNRESVQKEQCGCFFLSFHEETPGNGVKIKNEID